MVLNKIILFLLILFCILNHQFLSHSINIDNETSLGIGIVLDMESWIGKSIHMCITMAISDFYALNHSYRTRIVLHTMDSKGDPLKALSAVDHLVRNVKVQAIIGPETHLQPKLLSLFADKAKVPIFSLAAPSSILEYPYLFHIKEDESIMAKSVVALVESYKWRHVIFIYEDTDDGRVILPYLVESFQDKSIQITYRSVISLLATCDEITQQLRKLMTFQTTIIIVHMSPSLASRLFLNAKRLGMMREEYAWILTEKTVDLFRSTDSEVIESIQGALGFRPYVPASSRLHNLTARWHNFFYRKYPTSLTKEVPVLALWAYDTIWALAESVQKVEVLENGPSLLNEILKIRFKGISGGFQLSEGKVISNGYEIMNAIDYGEKRVGYWTLSEGIKEAYPLINRGHRYSSMHTEAVIWPGGSTTAPKGRMLQTIPGKELKIGVLKIRNFKYFMDVENDDEKNVTNATGFSVDVFKACIREIPYIFISFENASYDDLVQKVYNKEIDAVVGDSTILANRSEYVDFTAIYSDLGVGTLARIKKKDMWFFLKPLDLGLWLTAIASLMLTGFVVWAIEYMNQESECSEAQRIGTILWLVLLSLFFAQREKLSNNLSRFVMFVWLLVVLILITSYTATLTSLLTVEQFELVSKGGIVGFHGGSFMRGVTTVSNLHFEDHKKRAYYSYEDYAHALSEDGEADAIVDEIPYIKMFLGRYSSGDYALVSSQPITSGFGFIFQKGSPLVGEVSREIARMRLEGTLGGLEKKWFENQLSIPSQNSTMTKALKLDRFGGLFIINGSTLALALMISVICLLCAKMELQNIISFVCRRNLMATIRYLLYRNVVRT